MDNTINKIKQDENINLDENDDENVVFTEEDILKMELWDHYSGLPNPLWYTFDKGD
jgi:hypothetical protein